jgi:hypothetical protein
MLLDRLSLSRRIAASASAGTATFPTITGVSLIAKTSIGVALLIAAPLAAAQVASPWSQARLVGEPAWGPFVYERLGATPSVRFGWSATAAVARVESLGTRVQVRPATTDRASVAATGPTISRQTTSAEHRSRD